METYLNVFFKTVDFKHINLKSKKNTASKDTNIIKISLNPPAPPRFSEHVKYIPLHSSYYHHMFLIKKICNYKYLIQISLFFYHLQPTLQLQSSMQVRLVFLHLHLTLVHCWVQPHFTNSWHVFEASGNVIQWGTCLSFFCS